MSLIVPWPFVDLEVSHVARDAVSAESEQRAIQRFVVRGNGAALARRDVFHGMEAEAAHRAVRARANAPLRAVARAVARAECVGGVLDDHPAVALRRRGDALH